MFHIYNFGSVSFQDWLDATNQLYYTQHLELGRCHQDYIFAQASDIQAQPQDQFLLFCDDEAGICGSAAVVELPYDLEIKDQIALQDTWMVRNVFFNIRADYSLQHQVEQFHLGLFEHLWQLAQRKDLEYFNGFTFTSETPEEEQGLHMAIAVVPLTKKIYKMFIKKRETSFKKIDLASSFLLHQTSISPCKVSQ